VRLASLELHKEAFSFSAGHFTVFSATERELLHGHNYNVSVVFHFAIQQNGLSFDYRYYKKKLFALCEQLDKRFLLPSQSPYLKLEEQADYWVAHFNHKKLPFLKEDVLILPITNVTIEELAFWFLQNLLSDQQELTAHAIHSMAVKVYNGPKQSAGATWDNK
jgi:6-pyruvoyltetrahydropterin/6-carboxytetrahydropterin synthase